jgi:hypothetical protein
MKKAGCRVQGAGKKQRMKGTRFEATTKGVRPGLESSLLEMIFPWQEI